MYMICIFYIHNYKYLMKLNMVVLNILFAASLEDPIKFSVKFSFWFTFGVISRKYLLKKRNQSV